jgi:predicted nucleic acid-binding protein
LTTYLDTSVVVSLFTDDAHTERAKYVVSNNDGLIVSDLTAVEFSSALAIQYRSGRASEANVRAAFSAFDGWYELSPERVEVLGSDIRGAAAIIRSLDHPLRAADATHLLISRRLGATLATFDQAMARAAPALGIRVTP